MTPSRPYHHAHLRQTLLGAAVSLIGEIGPRAFTLREVARRAGVSHNAPYRHFASKDELLATVAREGFARLATQMEAAMEKGKNSLDRLQLCGCGYVEFALRWPHHLVVMFDVPGILGQRSPADPPIGKNAFQVLLDCITAAQQAGDLPAGDSRQMALAAWSLVHGIAKLAISGNLPLEEQAVVDFTRHATHVLLAGLDRFHSSCIRF